MDYTYEQNLMNKGHKYICGLDEAGRGPLAGPIVAGAVIIDPENCDYIELLNDSKKLTAKRRDTAFEEIISKAYSWAVGVVSAKEIDQHGLGLANKIVMKRAWSHLKTKPDFIACDYIASILFETPNEIIIGGDGRVASVAAASIVAKVIRDRMMKAFDKKYPEYGFAQHKGYGTKLHMQKLEEFGVCDIHRKSFAPVKRVYLFS